METIIDNLISGDKFRILEFGKTWGPEYTLDFKGDYFAFHLNPHCVQVSIPLGTMVQKVSNIRDEGTFGYHDEF